MPICHVSEAEQHSYCLASSGSPQTWSSQRLPLLHSLDVLLFCSTHPIFSFFRLGLRYYLLTPVICESHLFYQTSLSPAATRPQQLAQDALHPDSHKLQSWQGLAVSCLPCFSAATSTPLPNLHTCQIYTSMHILLSPPFPAPTAVKKEDAEEVVPGSTAPSPSQHSPFHSRQGGGLSFSEASLPICLPYCFCASSLLRYLNVL